MIKISTKVTYSLDPATVLEIRELATAWGVPKSEVVRRAVHIATLETSAAPGQENPVLTALDSLQAGTRLTKEQRQRWADRARDERKASSRQ